MDNLIEEAVIKYGMCKNGDNIIVALSGGADSVCLLHNFISIREKYNLDISACHVNHSLRGAEADLDMRFCEQLCSSLGIALYTKTVDVHAVAGKMGVGCEEAGRNVRYEFFDFLSKKYQAKIATAHNSNDNLETTVYNLTRGTLLRGLSGIPKIRGSIIRPLILTSREDIESYCSKNGLDYVTDSTNLQDDFNRNKLRHRVVPCLKEINPSVENTVLRMNESLSEISEYLTEAAEALLSASYEQGRGYRSADLCKAHRVILKEATAVLLRKQGYAGFSAGTLEDIIKIIHSGGKLDLTGSLTAVNKQGYFRIVDTSNTREQPFDREVDLKNLAVGYEQKHTIAYNNRTLTLSCVKISRKIEKSSFKNIVDSGIMESNIKLRTRRAGDRMRLPGRGVGKSLKKLMNELKIPEEKRSSLLLIADGSEVLWLEGVGASQTALPKSRAEEGILITAGE